MNNNAFNMNNDTTVQNKLRNKINTINNNL
jgi:hypothetical protein